MPQKQKIPKTCPPPVPISGFSALDGYDLGVLSSNNDNRRRVVHKTTMPRRGRKVPKASFDEYDYLDSPTACLELARLDSSSACLELARLDSSSGRRELAFRVDKDASVSSHCSLVNETATLVLQRQQLSFILPNLMGCQTLNGQLRMY